MRFELDTPASAEALWEVLEDYRTWSSWGPWQTSDVERPGDDLPAGVGAIRRLTIGRRVLREETTRFEPTREMRYRVLEGIPVRDYEGVVTLEPTDVGTRVTWSSTFRGQPTILGPVVRRSLQAQFPGIVGAFAAAAEARHPRSDAAR
ncbi:MAG TPA: SRPBCC family protein [Acidimicrobiia bacterium]|nr:SRPBCC family protein [Acidimicrobiia bacterium]